MIVGRKAVALGEPCYVIAEIGINHNGSVSPAKALIRAAADAGCDAVKFQKRTVPVIYTEAAAPVRRHGIRLVHA